MLPFVTKSAFASSAENVLTTNTVGNSSENVTDVELYANFVKKIDEVTRGVF